MAAVSDGNVLSLFKKVYGDLHNLLPKDQHLGRDIDFSEKQKVGDSWNETVCLTHETGFTLSSGTDAFELNPSIAGVVKSVAVSPYVSVLPSIVPWAIMSRSAGGNDEKSFFSATKHIVKNNLTSHSKLQEILRLHGQSARSLGYVSYATATYRGVSFTAGAGALVVNGTSVTFTAGINAASKMILLAPGSFASGIWCGMEGVKVNQIDANNAIVATGKLVTVDSAMGVIQVDFTPVAASSVTSHRVCFDGQESAKDMVGVDYIMRSPATLFGLSTANYSLWSSNVYDCGGQKLTLARFQTAIANVVNKSGLEGDVTVYLNPRSWATLASTEAGLRNYDQSYNSSQAENGFRSIKFECQAGTATFKPHRIVKEGDAYCLFLPDWSRSGSSEVSFKIPGMTQEIIFPLQNQAGHAFRSFSDQYIFCHGPARQLLLTNINDESPS